MWCLLASVLVESGCAGSPITLLEKHYAYVNGRWFDGAGFQPDTPYTWRWRKNGMDDRHANM